MNTKRTDTDRVLAALRGPAAVTSEAGSPRIGQRENHVRFTFDMDRAQHRFVKRFVLDCDTTSSAATRALWALVEQDSALAERLRGYLVEPPARDV